MEKKLYRIKLKKGVSKFIAFKDEQHEEVVKSLMSKSVQFISIGKDTVARTEIRGIELEDSNAPQMNAPDASETKESRKDMEESMEMLFMRLKKKSGMFKQFKTYQDWQKSTYAKD